MPLFRHSFISFLAGGLCVVLGIAGVFLLNTKVTLDCIRSPRATDQCEITATGLMRSHTQQIRLGDISGATVEHNTDWLRRRGSRTRYRVVLQTKSGPIPLTEGYASGQTQHQRMADQIKAFLSSRSKPTLHLAQDDRWLGYLVGAGLITLGLTLSSGHARKFLQ
jgi:hypothetical protein